jgi:hypothetical protein
MFVMLEAAKKQNGNDGGIEEEKGTTSSRRIERTEDFVLLIEWSLG